MLVNRVEKISIAFKILRMSLGGDGGDGGNGGDGGGSSQDTAPQILSWSALLPLPFLSFLSLSFLSLLLQLLPCLNSSASHSQPYICLAFL